MNMYTKLYDGTVKFVAVTGYVYLILVLFVQTVQMVLV
jgi:hypothetical protein